MSPEDRIAELEAEVAYLKDELGLRNDADRAHWLRVSLGLRGPGCALMLERLYSANGGSVSKWALLDAMPPLDDTKDRDVKIVDIRVCWIRKAIGKDAIETIWGYGYKLTPAGLEKVRQAMAQMVPLPDRLPALYIQHRAAEAAA